MKNHLFIFCPSSLYYMGLLTRITHAQGKQTIHRGKYPNRTALMSRYNINLKPKDLFWIMVLQHSNDTVMADVMKSSERKSKKYVPR